MDVLLEVLRVLGVKQDLRLKRLVADLLERDRRPRDVLRQAFLGGLVEDADAVVDTEPGMLPGQEVSGEAFVQEFAVHQELDDPTPEDLDHRLEPRERDEKERTFIIKPALQNEGVEVGVPAEHVSKRLVRDGHAGEKRSARRLSVELIDDSVDQSGDVGEKAAIVYGRIAEQAASAADQARKNGRSAFGIVKTNWRWGSLRRTSFVKCSAKRIVRFRLQDGHR